MEILDSNEILFVSGGMDRESMQFTTSMFAGLVSGGNGFLMAATAWGAGYYHDFQSGLSIPGPSGPSSNHLTTMQHRNYHSH